MYRIIPFFIFFTAVSYLFYGPVPMDKINKTVETRSCYQLKLMDQDRLIIPKTEENVSDNSAAFIIHEKEAQKKVIINHQSTKIISLVMDQKY